MDLIELKLNNLGIDKKEFGKIYTFVDFGNVNFWYEKDRRDWNENTLKENEKLNNKNSNFYEDATGRFIEIPKSNFDKEDISDIKNLAP